MSTFLCSAQLPYIPIYINSLNYRYTTSLKQSFYIYVHMAMFSTITLHSNIYQFT